MTEMTRDYILIGFSLCSESNDTHLPEGRGNQLFEKNIWWIPIQNN